MTDSPPSAPDEPGKAAKRPSMDFYLDVDASGHPVVSESVDDDHPEEAVPRACQAVLARLYEVFRQLPGRFPEINMPGSINLNVSGDAIGLPGKVKVGLKFNDRSTSPDGDPIPEGPIQIRVETFVEPEMAEAWQFPHVEGASGWALSYGSSAFAMHTLSEDPSSGADSKRTHYVHLAYQGGDSTFSPVSPQPGRQKIKMVGPAFTASERLTDREQGRELTYLTPEMLLALLEPLVRKKE